MRKIEISPSILSADYSELGKLVEKLEKGGADSLHLDVADGHFVRNISFGASVIRSLRPRTSLPFKVHLMIDRPDLFVEQFGDAGSDMLIIHRESPCNIRKTIKEIKKNEMKVGIALNPDSDLDSAFEFLPKIDTLLLMSIVPGFAGQKFIPNSIERIKRARKYIDKEGFAVKIAVDGSINLETVKKVREAGADELIAATAIVNSGNIAKAIRDLRGNKN